MAHKSDGNRVTGPGISPSVRLARCAWTQVHANEGSGIGMTLYHTVLIIFLFLFSFVLFFISAKITLMTFMESQCFTNLI
jgi:hypothetical protein